MSASLFYGLRLAKGFFGKRSDKYAKNMNTKQTITGNRTTTALKLPVLQKGTSRSASRAGTRLHLLQLPKQSSVSFSVIASPQRAAASNRIWWLHTDKSSCCCCHSGCTFPTPSHESSGQDFYCLLYYCISRGICFKYALSLLPFVPMAFVPAFALPFALQISSPIFMYGVYYALLFRASFFLTLALCAASASVVAAACVDRKCLILKSVLHFVSQLRVWFRFLFLCDCVFFVLFSFPTIVWRVLPFLSLFLDVVVVLAFCCLGFWFLFRLAVGYLWDICKCVGSYLRWGFVLAAAHVMHMYLSFSLVLSAWHGIWIRIWIWIWMRIWIWLWVRCMGIIIFFCYFFSKSASYRLIYAAKHLKFLKMVPFTFGFSISEGIQKKYIYLNPTKR